MIAAVFFAKVLRLNKTIALAASNISFPAAIPFIFYAALVIGHLLLSGELNLSPGLTGEPWNAVGERLGEWVLGSVVLAVIVAAVGGSSAYVLTRLLWMIRGRWNRGHA